MHARYETAWEEYNRIDAAQPSQPKDSTDPDWNPYYRAKRGMQDNNEETTLLRQAILHQVPDTDEELTVLSFHAWGLFDEVTELTDVEKRALEQGLNNIFDYLVSEGQADMQRTGKQFSSGAMLAFHRRRYRTGLTAED